MNSDHADQRVVCVSQGSNTGISDRLRDDRWSSDIDTLKLDIPFKGASSQEGPSVLMKLVLGTDFSFQDVLNCYLPDSELRLWIKWSNRKTQVLRDMDRPGWCPEGRHWPPRFLSSWKDITLSEMRRWLVILIARGVLAPQVPTKDLWATGGFADYSKSRRLISRDRWVAISSVLCPYDPDETYEDPFDKKPSPPSRASWVLSWIEKDPSTRRRLSSLPRKCLPAPPSTWTIFT